MAVNQVIDVGLSKKIGGQLQIAKDAGVITDALVNSASTNAGLRAALLAPKVGLGDESLRDKTEVALKKGYDNGTLSDSAVNGVSTVTALIALTDAAAGTRPGILT